MLKIIFPLFILPLFLSACFNVSQPVSHSPVQNANPSAYSNNTVHQLIQCSGAYYASSYVAERLMDKRDIYKNFQEEGDSHLLASVWIVSSRNPQNNFDETYKKFELESLKIKNAWLQNISNRGNVGIDDLNKVTKDCTNYLGETKTAIFKEISLYISANKGDVKASKLPRLSCKSGNCKPS